MRLQSLETEPYRPVSGWPALQAILAVALILAVTIVSSGVLVGLISGGFLVLDTVVFRSMGALGVVQLGMIGLVWLAARRGRHRASEVLSLSHPLPGVSQVLMAMGGLLLLVIPYTGAVLYISPDSLAKDLKPFADMMASPHWWLVLVVVGFGAPLMEEFLFRGFLQSALARSRLGFVGASIVSTVLWTLLHYGYTVAGLVEVFLVGLYFCWLLWRSGSLWLPLICHALYNSSLVLILLTSVFKI